MPLRPTKWIWMNGGMVPWEKATVHVMTYGLHMGASIFEGIRCYDTPGGPAIFRLRDHIRRLGDSARIYRMDLPFTQAEVMEVCREVIRRNGLTGAYLRPLAWLGVGELGTNPIGHPVEMMVGAFEWGAYLGEEGLERGVDVCVSSWRRVAPDTIPSTAKAGGMYLSSQLISREAKNNGYDEGIGLDVNGYLGEGSAENLFVIRDGILYTPPATASILPGITRDTVITISRDLGIEVRERNLPREVLYVADELFFTGTAAEIAPIRSVDRLPVGEGKRGPVTTAIQKTYFGIARGEIEDRHGWLDHVRSSPDQPPGVPGDVLLAEPV
ncbi:MAG TPA: branched-chain amino acid transaminase [Longimicrobiaceae bacterium]|nr:branched-chain amino acid transaminase [Longimicrobiaceae bacterium]